MNRGTAQGLVVLLTLITLVGVVIAFLNWPWTTSLVLGLGAFITHWEEYNE